MKNKYENCGAETVFHYDECNQNEPKCNRLLICGVGGAGCNMTRHLQMNVKREGIDYLTFDTDKKCLDAVPRGRKILIGESTCHGTGTGRSVQKGKDSAVESKCDIEKAMDGHTAAIILFSAGGGTGTGAGPEINKIATEMGIETVVFAIKPFLFEAKIRNEMAQECIDAMQHEKVKVAVLDNERFLQRADSHIGMAEFLESMDDTIVDFVDKIPVSPSEGRDMREELTQTFDESAPKEVSMEQIMNAVCDYFHVTKEQVLSRTRKKDVVKARRIIMYLCKYIGGYSFNTTGTLMKRRDVAVRHGVRAVSKQYTKKELTRDTIDSLKKEIMKGRDIL
ncbi:MAG: hypothetical protein IJJ13_02775 [Lachnospiraceae bacterium]|nr:hypothetical protein [Lachnospiraceae bacterium]